jgi:flagellar biosynthesis GTPase FlhF
MTKEQLKAHKAREAAALAKEKAALAKEKAKEKAALEKEKAREKALLAKEKEKAEKEKLKAKEQEKKQKEKEKLQAKADKEAAKLKAKADKEAEKARLKREKLIASGKLSPEDDEEGMSARRPTGDDDEDEFLEYAKKNKGKGGKSKYDEDVQIDIFEGKGKKYKAAMMSDLEGKIGDEIAELREHFNWKEIAEAIGTMDFFIDAKNDECVEKGCDNIRTTQSYCRLHYLRNWKVIQKKRDILKEGKLQEYIEELISKYPPKYIEALLSDLSDDKEFYTVLNQLNITSEFDFEEDEFVNADDDDDDGDDIGIETISSSLRYEDE